ncbi:MAG: hypothetical protein ACP5M9_02835 [Candidatus Micrarchaeia archaeon]
MTLSISKDLKINTVNFKEFNNTGVFISDNCTKTYWQSEKILKNNNLRFMTLTETLLHLLKNEEFKYALKEKTFFISGKEINLSYYYSLISANTLKKGKGDIEKTLLVHGGTSQLSFYVASDYYAQFYESRYVLTGNNLENHHTNTIVGVKSSERVLDKNNIIINEEYIQLQNENTKEFKSLYSAALMDVLRLSNVIDSDNISNIIKFLKFFKR